jgi:hypothetical protein
MYTSWVGLAELLLMLVLLVLVLLALRCGGLLAWLCASMLVVRVVALIVEMEAVPMLELDVSGVDGASCELSAGSAVLLAVPLEKLELLLVAAAYTGACCGKVLVLSACWPVVCRRLELAPAAVNRLADAACVPASPAETHGHLSGVHYLGGSLGMSCVAMHRHNLLMRYAAQHSLVGAGMIPRG